MHRAPGFVRTASVPSRGSSQPGPVGTSPHQARPSVSTSQTKTAKLRTGTHRTGTCSHTLGWEIPWLGTIPALQVTRLLLCDADCPRKWPQQEIVPDAKHTKTNEIHNTNTIAPWVYCMNPIYKHIHNKTQTYHSAMLIGMLLYMFCVLGLRVSAKHPRYVFVCS
jgi:hypothetical protein